MICRRCNQAFKITKLHRVFNKVRPRYCELCMLRNFIDGIDEVTPPALLDRYTKNPALTGEEFERRLKGSGPWIGKL